MNTLLFLCTGNYYRSRFAELYFRHLAAQAELAWQADSRGLALDAGNRGPLSQHTLAECRRLRVATDPLRLPLPLTGDDLAAAHLVVAVKETEHRPLLRRLFPEWEHRVEYWEVHDLDAAAAEEALPLLANHVERLVERLRLEAAKQQCAS